MTRALISLPLLLLIACGDKAEDTGQPGDDGDGTTEPVDADDDGYLSDEDCDDTDPEIHPGADELCNGVDDNCDGQVDEDAVDLLTVYQDEDADGFGDPATAQVACEVGVGQTEDDSDCDDAHDSVNPEATEICDGLDNDCNDLVDEADSGLDLSTAQEWFTDADQDGYGDPISSTWSCEQPADTSEDDTDCDDGAVDIHPGADEICDGVDNDCDDLVDDEDDSLDSSTGSTFYLDADGDGYGLADFSVEACEPPDGYAPNDLDCEDGDGGINPGATEICDEQDNDCDGLVDDADDSLDLSTASEWHPDMDEDGYGDSTTSTLTCVAPSAHVADGSDCDDEDATAYPTATEICDEVDNDCDGDVDDADASLDTSTASTWYADSDSDGYGDPDSSSLTCIQPTGTTTDDSDCDDTDSEVNPDATEICDGIDNDCDTDVDEDDTDLDISSYLTFYADLDGDGYGDPLSSEEACTQPSDTSEDNTDCDDGDSSIYPGATEIPQDDIDQDCDGEDAPYAVTDLVEGDLVITEFMQNPNAVSDSFGEWFEIYNASGGTVDLDGLYVYDADTDSFTVSGEFLVEAGAYFVFGKSDDTSVNGGAPVDYAWTGTSALANGADEIYLAESSAMATVIDGVAYDGGPNWPDPTGASANLDPSGFDATSNDDYTYWCTTSSSSPYGSGDYGTPGADNESCF